MQHKKSVFIGIMIIAGSAIGAGMFSIPIVSAGMWFSWAIPSLTLIWLISYLSSLMLMEVSVAYPIGSSFNTFVTDLLGRGWALVMAFSICFMLYILLYAYFSAFGNMAMHTLGWGSGGAHSAADGAHWLQGGLGFTLGLLLAGFVWMSTAIVGRISIVLVVGMVISFLMAMFSASAHVSTANLFEIAADGDHYMSYVWAGLPYFITSFGFATMVPSLYKYYGEDLLSIKRSLLFGSLIALVIYSIWVGMTFGIIPRNGFVEIIAAGGNVGDLVNGIEAQVGDGSIQTVITLFTNFAIVSSFLGVGLSLFDYLADRLQFDGTVSGRLKTAALTFIPPGVASFFFPHGFITAIGFAGVVLYICIFLIPFLMVVKLRASKKESGYRLRGGKAVLYFIIVVSTVTVVCHVLVQLDFVKSF